MSPAMTLMAYIALAMCGGAAGVMLLVTRKQRRAMWVRAAGLDDNGDLVTLEGMADGAQLVRRREGEVMARTPNADEHHPLVQGEAKHRARWTPAG